MGGDIVTNRDWTTDTKNPDYNLVVVHAANQGYQAKINASTGSYLIHEWTQRMTRNIENEEGKTLATIFEEIQDTLHDKGKQQTVNIFNNRTGRLQFKVS